MCLACKVGREDAWEGESGWGWQLSALCLACKVGRDGAREWAVRGEGVGREGPTALRLLWKVGREGARTRGGVEGRKQGREAGPGGSAPGVQARQTGRVDGEGGV